MVACIAEAVIAPDLMRLCERQQGCRRDFYIAAIMKVGAGETWFGRRSAPCQSNCRPRRRIRSKITGDELVEPDHISRGRRPDQHDAAFASLNQRDAAQNERA